MAAAPACGGGRRCAPTSLRCSTRPAVGEGQHTALAGRLPRPRLRCSAPPKAGAAATRLALSPSPEFEERPFGSLIVCSRLRRSRHGRRNRAGAALCGGEQRSRGPGARSALRLLNCGVLSERQLAKRAKRVTPHGPRGAAQRSQRAALTAAPAASARFRLPCGCSHDPREVRAHACPVSPAAQLLPRCAGALGSTSQASNSTLPPAAAVLIVTVRSTQKRCR